jgi:hypothetical protein
MKSKNPKPRIAAVLFKVGGGWGNSIEWTSFPSSVHGWKTPLPVAGDVLAAPMESGKTLVLIFSKVRPCGDPADMFFADVEAVGYSDEIAFDLPKEQRGNPFGGYRAKESLEAAMALRNRRK